MKGLKNRMEYSETSVSQKKVFFSLELNIWGKWAAQVFSLPSFND